MKNGLVLMGVEVALCWFYNIFLTLLVKLSDNLSSIIVKISDNLSITLVKISDNLSIIVL
jgi:hypothetical protein